MVYDGERVSDRPTAKLQLHVQAHDSWDGLQMKLNSVAGQEINVNSPKQMKIFLYEILGLPKRYERKKVTTNETALRNSFFVCRSEA